MTRWNELLRRAAAPLAFLLALGAIVPVRRDVNVLTEYSLVVALHDAFIRGLHHGSEIAFPYGPWGFLIGGIHPQTLALMVLLRTAIAGAGLFVLWRRVAKHAGRPVASALIVILAFVVHTCWADTFLYFVPFLVLFDGLEDERDSSASLLLVVCAALLSLVKFPFLVMTAIAAAAVSAGEVLRRNVPVTILTYAAGVALFWFIARQRAADFVPYIRDALELSMGHGEAMANTSRLYEPPTLVPFLIAAVLFSVTAIATEVRTAIVRGIVFAGGWLGALVILFKSAFARADFFHIAPGCGVLLLTQLTYAATRFRSLGRIARVLLTCTIAVSLFTIQPFLDRGFVLDNIDTVTDSATNVVHLLRWPSFRDDANRFYAAFLATDPQPALPMRGDVIPGPAPIAFRNGFTYERRPVFESYCAYTPKLSQMNVRWLRERMPETILFDIHPIDRHFPSLEDGALWPILLACYTPDGALGTHAILRRHAGPPPSPLTPTASLHCRLGEKAVLPSQPGALRFARIRIELSRFGRLERLLYRTPPLQIRVGLDDASERRYRLARGMAENEFLLSPLVENRRAFVDLASGQNHARTVQWIVIESEDDRAYAAGYEVELMDRDFTSSSVSPKIGGGSIPIIDRYMYSCPR